MPTAVQPALSAPPTAAPAALLSARIRQFLARPELLGQERLRNARFTALTGGVSAEIWRVDSGGKSFVVKAAHSALKVSDNWLAPLQRSSTEVDWLTWAAQQYPDAAPPVLASDAHLAVFAMPWLPPQRYPLWKTQLMQGDVRLATAEAVGHLLGSLQARSAHDATLKLRFNHADTFYALRLEPYFLTTAQRRPALAQALRALVERTQNTRLGLVHGDVSPKNILLGARGPLFLDAECATWGDTAFDAAFCLNHLLLKALHLPAHRASLLQAADGFLRAYLTHCWHEPLGVLSERIAALLPALMLARVEGKSPVEYLTTAEQEQVRAFAPPLIRQAPPSIAVLLAAWQGFLRQTPTAAQLAPASGAPVTRPAAAAAMAFAAQRKVAGKAASAKPLGKMDEIVAVHALRVWDSRGRPTVEASVTLAGGASGSAIAPAGASKGRREAVELRDGDARLGGLDVGRALSAIERDIAPALTGLPAADQAWVDATLNRLDGTEDKSRLGGNALIAVSMAVLKAAAAAAQQPLWAYLADQEQGEITLPLPEIQIFGGGAHAAGRLDIQDFMVVFPHAASFSEALIMTAEIYRAAGALLQSRGLLAGVADEGGYWPAFSSDEEALTTLVSAIERAGFKPGKEVYLSLDIAASNFGHRNRYRPQRRGVTLDSAKMLDWLGGLLKSYPIISIEDPLAEDDEAGFAALTQQFGARCQIIGDDLIATQAQRVYRAAAAHWCNAALIKPNQAGTLTETRAALEAAKERGLTTLISARSGETEDVTISHLAVGWRAGQLKVGSFARSERMAKWNEVLRIAADLGDKAKMARPLQTWLNAWP